MKNSKCDDDYNIVKWVSLPYNIQEGQEKSGIKINFDWFVIGFFLSNLTLFHMET